MVVRSIESGFAAYASSSAMLTVIKQLRSRGLPDPLNGTALEAVGVPASMTAFVLKTLLFLGLIDESGKLSTECIQLRQASTEEYPNTLAQILRKAYIKVFEIVDPATDDETRVSDAFRIFEPAKQRDKMVRLFMGLCEEAGIVAKGSVRHKETSAPRQARPVIERKDVEIGPSQPIVLLTKMPVGLHPALAGLVADLAAKGSSWTKADRDRWLLAFSSNLDYAYPIKTEETPQQS